MTKKSFNESSGSYVGKWRIVQMDQWDQDFVDLMGPGHLLIGKDGKGALRFGAVEASIDCQDCGSEELEFTWEGFDEGDPVSGSGWVRVEESSMRGHLFFHMGDDSGFKAEKM